MGWGGVGAPAGREVQLTGSGACLWSRARGGGQGQAGDGTQEGKQGVAAPWSSPVLRGALPVQDSP